MKALKGFLFIALSLLLLTILFFPVVMFSIISCFRKKKIKEGFDLLGEWLENMAFSLDQTSNVFAQNLFNRLFIKKDSSSRFGNPDESISSVLGKNQRAKTLTNTGLILVWILDKIDRNHSIKSIGH